MSGGSALMSLGVRAMAANYAALQATGHNIANANVAGFSRQTAELKTAQGTFTGAGFFGQGVNVTTVQRAHDNHLTREAFGTRALAAADDARAKHIKQMELVFPTGEAGVGYAAGQLLNSMTDLAARPADGATRQVVLARAGDVASRFKAGGQQLDALQGGVTEELKANVKQLNELAKSVADLNQKIAAVSGSGQAPNDLLDARDRVISQISQFTQVSTVGAEDGSMAVFFAGGQRLVLGNFAEKLTVVPDADDASRAAIAVNDANGIRRLDWHSLGGGAMAGLMKFQNEDLVHGRTQLGQLAASVAGVMNDQQALGLDMTDPPGSGAPLFAIGAPVALAASSNAVDGSGKFIGSVKLTTEDASQLQASEYGLEFEGGQWQLTRLSDSTKRAVNSGDIVDGFRIDLGSPGPAASDRYLLQPVSRAATGMARVLDDIRGLAAASPVTAEFSALNTGTATLASLKVVDDTVDPQLAATFTFTDDAGAYNWELRNSAKALVSSGTGTWQAGKPMTLNGFEVSLNGVPKAGDALDVSKTQFPAYNNGNALAYLELRDAAWVGRSVQTDGTLGGGATITDAYAIAMGSVGVQVQGAQTASEISTALASQAEQARASYSGVSLDEEAARLIQYQQSYQAAAKVLQVAQSLFDTLLQATGR
jgi:flagellar hook-associated protein 1